MSDTFLPGSGFDTYESQDIEAEQQRSAVMYFQGSDLLS